MDDNRIKTELGTGGKIALFRYRKRMSLMDLGAAVDLSRQTLSRYERGESVPDLKVANEIANTLDIDIKDLLPGEIEIAIEEELYLKKRDRNLLYHQRFLDILKGYQD